MNISGVITGFVNNIIATSEYEELDRFYLTNQVLKMIGANDFDQQQPAMQASMLTLMDILVEYANDNQTLSKLGINSDILGANLMNLLVPRPSVVNSVFWQKYQESPQTATKYFYNLSKQSNYIKTREIAKNISYKINSEYGPIEITINLSKPEKDPKAIAAAKKLQQVTYPKCQLCMENEGFVGKLNYPARSNHRIVRLQLGDEEWGFQYSPYAYFNEHAIVLSKTHRDMHVNMANMQRLLAFVDLFPDYFIGSNADLPIVGGSILTHDHFQTGRHEMPMAKAPIETDIHLQGLKLVAAGIVKWPMSVIRLVDRDQAKLLQATAMIIDAWKKYSDPQRNIVAVTKDNQQHHTITPIVRKRDDLYEVDLVLRDNNVSAEFPDGIFHPHPDVQHIKKENIGLIEVMGLAILPPRLKHEMQEVAKYISNQPNEIANIHQTWADKLKATNMITTNNASAVVNQAVGEVFVTVLENAGVFKRTEDGQRGFMQFLKTICK
ncbi:UDP-glucose--hexose-1-phosphate uridylyltransferase [Periweissella beninensis]|uniref:UDP-glucose--hexose-1-phosphate uridylyltransferase n=1 Tax=Periweissella beninensis TaxID=504936 RepID=UPI0021A5986F|nr:UDP-glucose--hexose-1-phosphate uridylyltransferase [Periweissella beninensis]MCT4395750.1 UDP-glucose--hexose-1-phosphate uridylyltransferase [Periweissella beninensis]